MIISAVLYKQQSSRLIYSNNEVPLCIIMIKEAAERYTQIQQTMYVVYSTEKKITNQPANQSASQSVCHSPPD
jgi:hypothetical protein